MSIAIPLDDSPPTCPIPSHLRSTRVGKSSRWILRLWGDAPYSELMWPPRRGNVHMASDIAH